MKSLIVVLALMLTACGGYQPTKGYSKQTVDELGITFHTQIMADGSKCIVSTDRENPGGYWNFTGIGKVYGVDCKL